MAIVVNYLTAGLVGVLINGSRMDLEYIVNSNWLPYSLFLGCIFIALFNVMAITTQKLGASVGSIANKMALVIPVVFAILVYNDQVNSLKIIGILLALAGILLSTLKPKTFKENYQKSDLLFPLILFIGSGFIDTYIKYVEEYLLKDSTEFQLFASFTFLTAFTIGLITIAMNKKHRSFKKQNFIGGLVLGTINFGSIYFLLETFRRSDLESSVIFPFNNVGVVILTTVLSLWIFKEKFNLMNKIGIAISVVAVILIAMGR